jgi:electron transport complex protein RnfD
MNLSIPGALSAAPHAHDRSSVDRIMLQVCLALLPATGFGFYCFGWPAILLWLTTCGSAFLTEAICLKLRGHPLSRLQDSSALLTGWLLAICLPPWAPWWIGVGGAAFAIGIGKQLYGGIGQNLFNPAMLARTALLVSFPLQMTTWVDITPFGAANSPDFYQALAITFGATGIPDGITGASILGQVKATYSGSLSMPALLESEYSPLQSLLGNSRGSLGETSELFILAGGLWLLYKRVISWHIPAAMLATTALMATLFYLQDAARFASPLFHLSSGSIMLGAFFIATDYVTSPTTNTGKLLFGAGCGMLLYIIRTWGGFPEGVAFAVIFMNALTPLIDRISKPRIYGRTAKGQPIPVVSTLKVKVK